MSDELKKQPNYTHEDVLNWVTAQVEATRESEASLPAWMIGAFEANMKRETDGKDTVVAQSEEKPAKLVIKRDNLFRSELVYCKVEDTVFTVIKDWLMVGGSAFQAMFSLPTGDSTASAAEGARITNPIILEQTSAENFRAFLCLLYGSRGKPLRTYDEWLGALEIATRWNFEQICRRAMEGLDPLIKIKLGPSARVLLGRQFSVLPWLRAGLTDLMAEVIEKKATPISLTNASETDAPLDALTVANVFFACYEQAGDNRSFSDTYCVLCNITRIQERPISINCQDCKSRRIEVARTDTVNRIFGTEIAGCTYDIDKHSQFTTQTLIKKI